MTSFLAKLHRAFYDFAGSLTEAVEKPDPYQLAQEHFNARRDAARKSHGKVNDVEKERQEWLHGALKGKKS